MTHAVLLSFTCSIHDAEPICLALRGVSDAPLHVREEMVRGIDFADAGTAERVTGALRRAAIELTTAVDQVETLVEAAGSSRRRLPIRWRAIPIMAEGRLP
jgi:hypothetical protein